MAATHIPLMDGMPHLTRLATTAPSTTPATAHQFTETTGIVSSRYFFRLQK